MIGPHIRLVGMGKVRRFFVVQKMDIVFFQDCDYELTSVSQLTAITCIIPTVLVQLLTIPVLRTANHSKHLHLLSKHISKVMLVLLHDGGRREIPMEATVPIKETLTSRGCRNILLRVLNEFVSRLCFGIIIILVATRSQLDWIVKTCKPYP